MKIAVIGGGAAGFFAAIRAKEVHAQSSVTIFEKTQKLLSKVKISGGGRCNVTNGMISISRLTKCYPRGAKALKKAFQVFSTDDTFDWFQQRGVELYVQDDERAFPTSDDSQTIIDCFLRESKKLGVKIILGKGVQGIREKDERLELKFKEESLLFDKVIVATGGSPSAKGLEWLKRMGHDIEIPVPSLFTFNMPSENIVKLKGVVAPDAAITIQGTKIRTDGPLLITHWGMSGPAILKLSAFGARVLHERDYDFNAQVNWVNEKNESKVLDFFRDLMKSNPKKLMSNLRPFQLPERLWLHLLEKAEVPLRKPCGELSKKNLNKMGSVLCKDVYAVKGKTTFKEEFVTAGGVSLESINMDTMESRVMKNLYFAGEVMDIDGITGGYNFQAAWTTGFIAGELG